MENQRFMLENQIQPTGHNVPRPVTTFIESGLPKYMIDKLMATPKYERPTAIQS